MKKRSIMIVVSLLVAFAVAYAFAGTKSFMDAKPGDMIYACNCGKECPCDSMSKNPGKCTCGKDMVKVKVTKVEGGMVYVEGAQKPAFKQQGKYMCNCGKECPCDSVSQNPGKCSCGKEMKAVEKKS